MKVGDLVKLDDKYIVEAAPERGVGVVCNFFVCPIEGVNIVEVFWAATQEKLNVYCHALRVL